MQARAELGSTWKALGEAAPAVGTELTNKDLSTALLERIGAVKPLAFTRSELDAYALPLLTLPLPLPSLTLS